MSCMVSPMTTSHTDPDVSPRDVPPAPESVLLVTNRIGDRAFVNQLVSRVQWTYAGLLEEIADEALGLPNRDAQPDLYARVLEEPGIRRLRQGAVLHFAATVGPRVVEAFITETRRAGGSWTDVGDAMEVARQTARTKWAHLDVPAGPPARMPKLRDLLAERAPATGGPTS
jgi:hypothetical protein